MHISSDMCLTIIYFQKTASFLQIYYGLLKMLQGNLRTRGEQTRVTCRSHVTVTLPQGALAIPVSFQRLYIEPAGLS